MAFPVYVGATAQQTVNGTPTAFNVPAGAQTGDLLFAMVNTAATSSNNLVLPAGWTLIQANTDDQFREKLTVAFTVHTGAANYTFSTSNSLGGRIRMIAYRGQAASNPINSSALVYSQAAGATLSTTPIAAAAGVDSIEICFAADLDNRNTTVSGAGVTSRLNSSTWLSFDIADSNATPGSNTTAKTFTWGVAGTKRTIINATVSGTAPSPIAVAFSGPVNNQSATVGVSGSMDLSGFFTGNQTPFTYSLVAGSLTGTGLSLNSSTGIISGTPTAAGTISGLQVRATDSAGNTAQTNQFSITVAAASVPVSFSGTVSNQSATVGTAFNLSLASFFSGSLTPFTYSLVAGSLTGTGLSLNSSTGVISGTPTAAGTISGLRVRATDTASNTAQTGLFNITASAAGSGSGTITSQPLARNNGTLVGIVSLEFVDIINPNTGALVVRKTGLSTNGSSMFAFSDAAVITGTTYRVDWRETTGQFGSAYVVAS